MHKRFKKRVISILLCISIIIAMLPMSGIFAFADEEFGSGIGEPGTEESEVQNPASEEPDAEEPEAEEPEAEEPEVEEEIEEPEEELFAQIFAAALPVDIGQQKLSSWRISPGASGTVAGNKWGLPGFDGSDIESADTSEWIPAVAPGTVLGNLLDAKIYDHLFEDDNEGKKNVFFSDNLSKLPMADFDVPWWYATEFTLPLLNDDSHVNINFQGIAFTGEIYVNGHKLTNKNINITSEDELKDDKAVLGTGTGYADPASTTPLRASLTPYPNNVPLDEYKNLFLGSFRHYDVDITDYVNMDGTPNDIKVKVYRPNYKTDTSDAATSGGFSYYWVDWVPQPADSNMGLTGNVFVNVSGAVRMSHPAVAAEVSEDLDSADLTFYVDLTNMTDKTVRGTLEGIIRDPDGRVVDIISKNVLVAADVYCQEVALKYTIDDPKLWWPNQYGDQPLYNIYYTFSDIDDIDSDHLDYRFGIRELTAEINTSAMASGNNAYMMQVYVNHVPIVLKGGGYCPTDIYFRHSDRSNKAVVDYLVYMGMNMIRDEGKFYSNDLLDLMDENGILLMTGWCCCDRHQNSSKWTKAERFVAYEHLYAQLRNARSHPCMGVWFNGSDSPPVKMVEYKYLEIEGKLHWTKMGVISSNGSAIAGTYTGVFSGMHMDATYDSQTPSFYYTDKAGNFGFVSEGGGGAGIPVVETIRRVIPNANQWPYNSGENGNVWNYHACRQSFNNFNQIASFIDNMYGQSDTIEEFAAKAQLFDYDSQRAQYEAQTMFRFVSTSGLVNWMLNNAWPTFYWNQFDYYLNPHGSTYGVRKANEPVHIMYDVYNKNIMVLNNTREEYDDLTATLKIYDINGRLISNGLSICLVK